MTSLPAICHSSRERQLQAIFNIRALQKTPSREQTTIRRRDGKEAERSTAGEISLGESVEMVPQIVN
ncbi:hypothetical protein BaRGS_00008747, partial [Batillaria attramentaria]